MGIILVSQQYPREDRSRLEINTQDPDRMASAVYMTWPYPSEEKLNEVLEHFGGIESFTAANMSGGMKRLRDAIMRSKNFSSSKYSQIFDGTTKIARNEGNTFAAQPYFLTDLNKFMKVWRASRFDAVKMLHDFIFLKDNHRHHDFSELLQTVHADDCKGDDPSDQLAHYYCKRPVLYHPDRRLAFHRAKKKELEAYMSSEVIDFIHENILDSPINARANYAKSLIVSDDHWEKLAKDPKREVLNAVADNILLPTHVAEEIVRSHKTPGLRIVIAKQTVDQNLLSMIWNGTKSVEIREAVESNALFI